MRILVHSLSRTRRIYPITEHHAGVDARLARWPAGGHQIPGRVVHSAAARRQASMGVDLVGADAHECRQAGHAFPQPWRGTRRPHRLVAPKSGLPLLLFGSLFLQQSDGSRLPREVQKDLTPASSNTVSDTRCLCRRNYFACSTALRRRSRVHCRHPGCRLHWGLGGFALG